MNLKQLLFPRRKQESETPQIPGDAIASTTRVKRSIHIVPLILAGVAFVLVVVVVALLLRVAGENNRPVGEESRKLGSLIFERPKQGGVRAPRDDEEAAIQTTKPRPVEPREETPVRNGKIAPLVPNQQGISGPATSGVTLSPRETSGGLPNVRTGDPRIYSSGIGVTGSGLVSSHDLTGAGVSGLMGPHAQASGPAGGTSQDTELGRLLKPTHTAPSVARTMANANRYVMDGETLGTCVMDVKFVSDVPSKVVCQVGTPIYGGGGHDLLFPAGSVVVGEVQGAAAEGSERVFAIAAKLRTPTCKTPPYEKQEIDLISPFTGSLGEGGLGGQVDTHLWKKLKNALPLMLVRSVNVMLTAGSGSGSGVQGQAIVLQNAGTTMTPVIQQDLVKGLTIPTTITLNIGEIVSVRAARNLFVPEWRCANE